MSHKLIRNSTAEFLIFTGQAGEQSIEARYEDETVWLSSNSHYGSNAVIPAWMPESSATDGNLSVA